MYSNLVDNFNQVFGFSLPADLSIGIFELCGAEYIPGC